MRQGPPGFGILKAPLDGLNDVQMVEDILKRAIVRQSVQQVSYGLFGLQATSISSVSRCKTRAPRIHCSVCSKSCLLDRAPT